MLAAAPILVPVLMVSGIGGGMGVASATHGIAQSFRGTYHPPSVEQHSLPYGSGQRINGRDYAIDLGIGSVTGLVGSGAVAGAAAAGTAAGVALAAQGTTF